MDLKNLAWNTGILLAIGGVCAVVVGLALGASANGSSTASVVFNVGVFMLVLMLAVAISTSKIDLRRIALAAGMLGALGGLVIGNYVPFLLIASLVALVGAAVATRHPRASICLMLVPAVGGWVEVPSLYSIPARVLTGACLALLVHLIRARFSPSKPALESGREVDSRKLSQ